MPVATVPLAASAQSNEQTASHFVVGRSLRRKALDRRWLFRFGLAPAGAIRFCQVSRKGSYSKKPIQPATKPILRIDS
jgi:hypothetical protein